eukprot:63764-Pyramimonas_sp.AAC.1
MHQPPPMRSSIVSWIHNAWGIWHCLSIHGMVLRALGQVFAFKVPALEGLFAPASPGGRRSWRGVTCSGVPTARDSA